MTISQPTQNLQQSTNRVQQSAIPIQQSQKQQQGIMPIQQDQLITGNIQAQQQLNNQNQQHQMMASNIQAQQQSQPQMMASNIQAQQQSYNPNQQQQQQKQQAPSGVNPSVSNLKAQLEQINQGTQPEMGPIGINGQQVYPPNSNQTVISPGLNNTPLINNKSGNLIVQNAVPQGQENVVNPPLDLVNSKVPFPSINELPEAIRLTLQGTIKTLLQMNAAPTATTTTTKSTSPTKTTSATKAKNVASASPQTNAIKLNPAI